MSAQSTTKSYLVLECQGESKLNQKAKQLFPDTPMQKSTDN
jgi:hypothetical protein